MMKKGTVKLKVATGRKNLPKKTEEKKVQGNSRQSRYPKRLYKDMIGWIFLYGDEAVNRGLLPYILSGLDIRYHRETIEKMLDIIYKFDDEITYERFTRTITKHTDFVLDRAKIKKLLESVKGRAER